MKRIKKSVKSSKGLKSKKDGKSSKIKKKGLKKKTRPVEDEDEDDDEDLSIEQFKKNSWMIQGSKNIKKEVKRQKMKSDMGKRAPEFFLRDGESKTIRFVSDEPICALYRYSLRVDGKWVQVSAPPPGQDDPGAEAGLRASLKHVYEVLDRDGYKDKNGKVQKNVPKFFPVSSKVFEQLEMLREKLGSLRGRDVLVMRSGSGVSTTYSFIPEAKSKKDFSKIKSIAGDFVKYYAPPSEEDFRALVREKDEDDYE